MKGWLICPVCKNRLEIVIYDNGEIVAKQTGEEHHIEPLMNK